MTKQKIRTKISEKRNKLSKTLATDKSHKIHKRFIATAEFKNAKSIMFYIKKNNEVDTESMIELALRKRKTVCAPCTDKTNRKLHPAVIKNLKEDLAYGHYRILEPRKKDIKPKRIDLIVIPGIAFDEEGHRLGRGKAYYDNFLKHIKDIPKIGLAYNFQILKKLPRDGHDIPMDKIITEKRIIKIEKSKPR